ncbi:hypothetical protein L873DRAFT_1825543 [Choiromyces venosus 120613-1]|uniref:Flavin reductase like domain-containing protein n=1 Tax=Choiromyces venosus 120613-1 TaxID=1336337 RepID=A0A3N4K2U6_9PEZI|nr:hypothetical protein L873DRAFT_1825543 [Choiromyces venosus 120613-1]
MTASGAFTVHVLRSTPRAAHVASLFSKAKLSTSPWESVRDPRLRELGLLGREEDVLYRLRCETYRSVQIEDHQFWVGRVRGVDLLAEKEQEEGNGEGGFGLMYAEGMFRDVGKEVGSDEGGNVDDGSG